MEEGRLEEAFLGAVQGSRQDAERLLAQFEALALQRLEELDGMLVAAGPSGTDRAFESALRSERYLISQEWNSWKLFRALFADRAVPSAALPTPGPGPQVNCSDEELVVRALLSEQQVREVAIALDWLQAQHWAHLALLHRPHNDSEDAIPPYLRVPLPASSLELSGVDLARGRAGADGRGGDLDRRVFAFVRAGKSAAAMKFLRLSGQPGRSSVVPQVLPGVLPVVLRFRLLPAHDRSPLADQHKAFQKYLHETMAFAPHGGESGEGPLAPGLAPWLAAPTLPGGSALFHDASLSSLLATPTDAMDVSEGGDGWQEGRGGGGQEGNALAPLFRRTARKIAESSLRGNETLNKWERALYGAACGAEEALAGACESWADFLWAALVAVWQAQIERITATQPLLFASGLATASPSVPGPWDVRGLLGEIFNRLRSSPDPAIRKECDLPYHVAQAYVIQGGEALQGLVAGAMGPWIFGSDAPTTAALLAHIGLATPPPSASCPPSLLRFAASVVILLHSAGVGVFEHLPSRTPAIQILIAYIDYLIRRNKRHLIAGYVALIPDPGIRVEVYARFLASISPSVPSTALSPEREQCLQWAEEAGLDVPRITGQLVDLLIAHAHRPPTPGLAPKASAVHAATAASPAHSKPSTITEGRITRQSERSGHQASEGPAKAPRGQGVPEELFDPPLLAPGPSPPTAPADLERIAALEWLTYDTAGPGGEGRGAHLACLRTANALARAFVLSGNLNALSRLFTHLGTIIPDLLQEVGRVGQRLAHRRTEGLDDSDDAEDSERALAMIQDDAVREYLALELYLELHRRWTAWRSHRSAEPSPPALPGASEPSQFAPSSLSASLMIREELKRYSENYRAWRLGLGEVTAGLEAVAMSIISFPNGWMLDRTKPTGAARDGERRDQLHAIRKLCIPEACFKLFALFYTSQRYKECVEISTFIADGTHKLDTVFSVAQLRRFLSLVRRAAVENLRSGETDPFGLPPPSNFL